MLTISEIESYLRGRGLVNPSVDAAPENRIERVARRNLTYKLTGQTGRSRGYIVKQGFGTDGSISIANEAAAYRRLAKREDDRLDRYLARFVDYDVERDALIVELVANAQNLRDYHAGRGHFSITLARALGDALATLHRPSSPDPKQSAEFSTTPPWILSLHRPDLNMLGYASSANIEMITTVQQAPELGEHLDTLRRSWAPTTLIHNDIRWDNCVVYGKRASGQQTRLKLIDFELAQVGDPLWDVGCALSDYLSFWVMSIPMTGETQPDHFARLSRYPLVRMQPAIRALWQRYVGRSQLEPAIAAHALQRAVKYSAARLIQTGFERTQRTAYLEGTVICLLQLSLNIFEQTAAATVELFGIDSAIGCLP